MALDWIMEFIKLSDDILLVLFEFIPLSSLARLCLTCRRLHMLVNDKGWPTHFKHCHNKRTCHSLSSARSTWNPYENLKYDNLTDRAWKECSFIARPLSSAWSKHCVPSVALSNSRLIYGAGRDLHFYAFTRPNTAGQSPGVRFERRLTVGQGGHLDENMSGLAYMPDGSSLVASFEDGSLMEIFIPDEPFFDHPPNYEGAFLNTQLLSTRLLYKAETSISCLSTRDHLCLTLSVGGEANLHNLTSGTASNSVIGRHRCAHLSSSSPRYAALGAKDSVPLRIHSISESQLCPVPSLALGCRSWGNSTNIDGISSSGDLLSRVRRSNDAVLAMSDPPPHFGSSGQVLVSGWMDGLVRIYDLRSSHRYSPSKIDRVDGSSITVPTLSPVMSMYDRESRGIGTITSGGGAGCHVAASSLTDRLISFWDVRSPRDVWSVNAPVTKDPSTVYTLAMESSRLFGATQRRPFVYDFGPGLTTNTYPAVETDEADGLELQSNGIGYRLRRHRSHNKRDIE